MHITKSKGTIYTAVIGLALAAMLVLPHCFYGHPVTGILPEEPEDEDSLTVFVTLFFASRVPSIDPASLSNLQLRLRARDLQGSLASGAQVNAWADQSGNARNAVVGVTSALPPTFVDDGSGPNGGPFVRFSGDPDMDGQGDHLILGSNYIYSTTDGMTVIAVARPEASAVGNFIYDFGFNADDGYGLGLGAGDGSAPNLYMYASLNAIYGGTNASFDAPVASSVYAIPVLRIRFGQSLEYRLNGAQQAFEQVQLAQLTATEVRSNPVRTTSGGGPVTIGGQSKTSTAAGDYFGGDLVELIVYDRPLSDAELIGLECYFATVYGVAVPWVCLGF